jgi:hypothetical protein
VALCFSGEQCVAYSPSQGMAIQDIGARAHTSPEKIGTHWHPSTFTMLGR